MTDIDRLNYVMRIKDKQKLFSNYFCWLYLFTNENISGYYKFLDFRDKTVLIVTSSGDHALNALLHGAKSVESFDNNQLSKYLSELKVAAIKSLSREEFLLYFNESLSLFKSSKYYFDVRIYNSKIRAYLKDEYLQFWDYFFSNYSTRKIKKSFLFTKDRLNLNTIVRVNDYLSSDKNYYKLRNILLGKEIKYHHIDITQIPDLNRKYDLVILSNIASYLDYIYDKEHLKNFKELIDSIKAKDTRIVVTYLYDNMLGYTNTDNYIYDEKDVNKYFNSSEYEYLSFKSTDVYEYPRIFSLENRVDKILVNKIKEEI